MTPDRKKPGVAFWATVALLLAFLYALSSGPVLATAFWLRETTHRDEWYGAMWVYYPMIMLDRASGLWVIDKYITWWCGLLNTVGPG